MNSKIKLAGLGVIGALAVAASPYVIKIAKQEAIAADPVNASDSNFSAAQKTELDALIKDYIMKNPQVLMDSVNNYRSAQTQQEDQKAIQALKDNSAYLQSGSLPTAGNKSGDLTIVEFFDYNCGYCKQAYTAVQQGIDNDKGLRFVFVEMPILSESSHLASKYALASNKQGKYWAFHQALMKFSGPKNEETLLNLAKVAGLDVDKLKADAQSPEIEDQIKKNIELSQKLAISGTPAFIVGDEIVRGYIPFDAMKTIIDQQRKKKG